MSAVQFGFCLPVFANPGANLFRTPNYQTLDARTTLDMGRLAEKLGYDSLWVADHLMLGKDQAILEGWTVLSALAGSTERAKLGIIHMAHPFRHPAMVAKMTATLDLISGGRLIHFVDCGRNRNEYVAYGIPWLDDLEERIDRMLEGVQVQLALWGAEEPVSFQGKYYQLDEAVCTPRTPQRPHPPLWFGETNPAILQACARYGQGWNTVPVSLAELQRRLDGLAAACHEAGRPFAEVEKSLEIQVMVASDHASLRERLKQIVALAPEGRRAVPGLAAYLTGESDQVPAEISDSWLIGTPVEVEQRIRAYIRLGIGHFMLWFVDAPADDGLRLFADQVMRRFR
jgi:alkanesulfonate monooxygenase SsuD/methylene tetrahydromethanopterin reductase-like flavin-dependent oxidoreductase (luciferase family)